MSDDTDRGAAQLDYAKRRKANWVLRGGEAESLLKMAQREKKCVSSLLFSGNCPDGNGIVGYVARK